MTREGSPYTNSRRVTGPPSVRTRVGSFFATLFAGRPVLILTERPNRIKATIQLNSGTVSIGDDISQLLRGEGALLSSVSPTIIEGGGQVWGTASAEFIAGISTNTGEWLGWRDNDGTVGYLLYAADSGVNVSITEVLSGV